MPNISPQKVIIIDDILNKMWPLFTKELYSTIKKYNEA